MWQAAMRPALSGKEREVKGAAPSAAASALCSPSAAASYSQQQAGQSSAGQITRGPRPWPCRLKGWVNRGARQEATRADAGTSSGRDDRSPYTATAVATTEATVPRPAGLLRPAAEGPVQCQELATMV